MAKYKVLYADPILETHDFFIDTPDDLAYLPIEPSSAAVVATTGDIYVCTNAGIWVKFGGGDSITEDGTQK